MRGAIHRAASRLGAIASLGLVTGCATTVDVTFDEREDFSGYRSWDFAPRRLPKVDAPYGDPVALDARLSRSIERELLARGFPRNADRPDFLVSYHLSLRRRAVVLVESAAPYLLSSLTSSASYWIEGEQRKVAQLHEDLRLSIGFSEPDDRRRTWRAVLMRTLVNASVLPLDDAVGGILDRFPGPGEQVEVAERR
jgi:hypothetical protein